MAESGNTLFLPSEFSKWTLEPRIQERLARSVIQRFTLPVVNVRSGSCSHSMSGGGVPNIRWSEARVQLRLSSATRQNFSEEPMDVV